MSYYYSATQNAFFHDDLRENYQASGNWPNDLIEITDEYYQELLTGQSNGKLVAADENGNPVLIDHPEPDLENIKAQVLVERDRLSETAFRKIRVLESKIKLNSHNPDDDDTPEKRSLTAWETYLIALDEIDQQPNFPYEIEWPQMPN